MAYTKLFSSLLSSSVWAEPLATRVVWIAMLAMADRDGVVTARAPGIAKMAGVTRAECDKALACFAKPDPHSRTQDNEGRRAVETADGWQLLNYEAYRDRQTVEERRAKDAARQARKRDRDARHVTGQRDATVTRRDKSQRVHDVTPSETKAVSETKADTATERDQRARPWDRGSVFQLWNDASGSAHGGTPKALEACDRLLATHSEADIRSAAKAAKEEGWARDNGMTVLHFEETFATYLAKSKGTFRRGGKSGPAEATPLSEFKSEPLGRFDG